MPAKALEKSADVPPGPVMCTASPARAVRRGGPRIESTAGSMRSSRSRPW